MSIAAMAERRTQVRYFIIGFIFLVTSINYADRATFSIAGSAAARELGLSPIATGYILSAFAWAYASGANSRRRAAGSLRHQAYLRGRHRGVVAVYISTGLRRIHRRCCRR